MQLRLRRTSAMLCALVIAATSALGDETSDAIKKAEALYQRGSLGKAYSQLENAAASIARQLEEKFATTFPAPPKGWAARPARSPVRGKRKLGYGIRLHRNYSETEGRGVVKTQLIVDDQSLIVRMARLRSNPGTLSRMKYDRVPMPGGGEAFVRYFKDGGYADGFVFIADRIYISVAARQVDNRMVMTELLSRWDFAALRKLAGLN